jgi:hypothetical protein
MIMKTIEERLQEMVSQGAGFTRVRETPAHTMPLAAAHLLPQAREVWVCSVWPDNEFAQHWREYDHVEDHQHFISFHDAKGGLLYTIGELDPEEKEAARWEQWTTGDDAATRTSRAFVRALEVQIIGTDRPKQKGGE